MITKKFLLMSVMAAIVFAGIAQGEWVDQWQQKYLDDYEKPPMRENKVAITFAMEGVSKYIWRGFDMLDDRGALLPSVNMDWYDSGISTMVWSAVPLTEELGAKHEMRYVAAYTNMLWEETLHAFKYTVNWTYYDFPGTSSRDKDAQEIGLELSCPKAFMFGDTRLMPSYYVGKYWAAKSNAANREDGGWIHILGIDYEMWLFSIGVEKQIAFLSAELVYNDGLKNAESGWSHILLGVGTTFRQGPLLVRPEFNYQISLEDTVNDEDELWGGMSISYEF